MITKSFTAAIIGGGPAGCECALWLQMMGLHPIILERSDHLGGLQNLSPYQNQWIVGVMNTSGRELAHNIQKHMQQKEIPVIYDAIVAALKQSSDGFTLDVAGQYIHARFIVIAAGSVQHKDAVIAPDNQDAHDASFANQIVTANNGWQANLPEAFLVLQEKLLNKDGFIITNSDCATPVAGIFAIGEAANRMHPCVVTAMADGVVAAKAIQAACGN